MLAFLSLKPVQAFYEIALIHSFSEFGNDLKLIESLGDKIW